MQTLTAWLVYCLALFCWYAGAVSAAYLLGHYVGLPAVIALIVATGLFWLQREQRKPRPAIYVRAGSDWLRARHFGVCIAWGAKPGHLVGEFAYARSVDLSWDWWPTLVWERVDDSSSTWTGRMHRLVGWSWWGLAKVRGPSRMAWVAF